MASKSKQDNTFIYSDSEKSESEDEKNELLIGASQARRAQNMQFEAL